MAVLLKRYARGDSRASRGLFFNANRGHRNLAPVFDSFRFTLKNTGAGFSGRLVLLINYSTEAAAFPISSAEEAYDGCFHLLYCQSNVTNLREFIFTR